MIEVPPLPKSWGEHEVRRGAFSCLPDWQTVLDDLSLNMRDKSFVKVLPDFVFVTHRGERIASVEQLRSAIATLDTSRPCSAHLYISLLAESESFGWHEDASDVFYIQALGRTRCQVRQNGVHEYVLAQGDAVFIPKGVAHRNVSLTPRVGLSIGFD